MCQFLGPRAAFILVMLYEGKELVSCVRHPLDSVSRRGRTLLHYCLAHLLPYVPSEKENKGFDPIHIILLCTVGREHTT